MTDMETSCGIHPSDEGEENIGVSTFVEHEKGKYFVEDYFDEVATMYDAMCSVEKQSANGHCCGHIPEGKKTFKWISYTEAKERAFHFGSALMEKGFKPGQETYVGIYSENRTEWAITDLACSSFSMIGVSLYDSLGVGSSQFIINKAELGVVVCDTIKKAESLLKLKEDNAVPTLKLLVVMEPLSEEQVNGAKEKGVELVTFQEMVEFGKEHEKDLMIPIRDDIYSVCFTSGTAGDPKGVQLSLGNMIASITATYLNVKDGMSLSLSDRYLSYQPLAHMFERCYQAVNIVCGVHIGFFRGDIPRVADDFDILKPVLFINVPRPLNRIYDKQLNDGADGDDDDDELSYGRVFPLSSTVITGMGSHSNVSVEDTIRTKDTREHEKQRYYVEEDEDVSKASSVYGPEGNDDKGPVKEDIEEGKEAPEPPPSTEKPVPQHSFVDDETFGDGDPPDEKKHQMKEIEVNIPGSPKYGPTQPLEDFYKATEKFSPAVNAKKPILKKTTDSVSHTKPSMDQKSTKVYVPGELTADVKIRNALNESSSSQGVHLDSDVDLPGPSSDQKEVERESQVHDHVVKTSELSSDTKKTSYGHQNQKTQITLISIIWFLLSLLNSVSAEETCYRVLTASDVESKTSRFLSFNEGQYKGIEGSAFANAEAVERLDISNNCLQIVPDDVFDNMTNLFDIDMSHNKFSDFPLALHRPDSLKKLLNLNLMYNSVRYLGKDYFKGKEAVSNMNFDYNMIEMIHDTALDHLPALGVATFSGNVLTALPQLNLTQLGKLRQIDFSNNTLESLKIGHFSNFPEVTSITVTNEIMSLIIGTEREVVFGIVGNRKISCEENDEEIQKSKVTINFNFFCQYRNGSQHQLKGIRLPQNDYNTVMSDVVSHATPLSLTNDECPVYVGLWFGMGLSVFLNICIVFIVIVLRWKGFVCQRSSSTSEGKKVGDETENGPTCEEANELMEYIKSSSLK